MATFHATLSTVSNVSRAGVGPVLPVPDAIPRADQTITTSGTSQASTIEGASWEYWQVTVTGGNVWIKFGTGTPVAAAGDHHLILDGQTREFAAAAGQKVAVIDA